MAWAENEDNTEILHKTIAFPLLEKLVKAGDEKAKKYLKKKLRVDLVMGIEQ